jgi:hypothetical protein
MNHQPFREWLLSEDPLSNEQNQALHDHLKTCESCSQVETALKEVELAIRKVPQVEPVSGFTLRWQERLTEYQSHRQSRWGWVSIAATTLVATGLLALLISQLWSLINKPGPFLAQWLNRLVDIASVYYMVRNFASLFSGSNTVYVLIGMFFLTGIISFMSVLWLTAYRKFSLNRRVI